MELADGLSWEDEDLLLFAISVCKMLCESIQGPCVENQLALCMTTSLIKTLDALLGTVEFVELSGFASATGRRGLHSPINRCVCELYLVTLRLIHLLLEGNASTQIPAAMLNLFVFHRLKRRLLVVNSIARRQTPHAIVISDSLKEHSSELNLFEVLFELFFVFQSLHESEKKIVSPEFTMCEYSSECTVGSHCGKLCLGHALADMPDLWDYLAQESASVEILYGEFHTRIFFRVRTCFVFASYSTCRVPRAHLHRCRTLWLGLAVARASVSTPCGLGP